ncbi:cyclopropane-fatty-acyl-phospholipid synthase family protein [Acidiferrobacter sp.]|uniref:SAM-dependent methyltransferase n=1 Tax=Acidiferrobacter sp. TaxID=1872107 RepID=UPI00263959F1|nr:cyclopropane-fatty-acyl-phospholipid synthase family protein [Acidiferrobacter sp.]
MLEKILAEVIKTGHLTVRYPDGRVGYYGEGSPDAEWVIKEQSAIRRLIRNPWLQMGETYMDGAWDAPKGLATLLEALLRNIPDEPPASLFTNLKRHLVQVNGRNASRRHVAHHYDLDESLFRIFLDRDMHYSCAYFSRPDMGLEEAQIAKCELIRRKLELKAGQRVLDIGSGWGGLALYLARHADVDVTGITLSKEQHRVATARAREARLSDRVQFRLEDYREHRGLYDRIVSVGMFEHVGVLHYETFFAKIRERLAPGGLALLHHIGRSGAPGLTNPWIRRYIFPGGYNPALSEVLPPIEKTGLKVADIEVLKFHYGYTLHEWQRRFQARRAEVVQRWDERFARMWEFYLAACEADFAIGELVVFHIQMARALEGLRMTRDAWYTQRDLKDKVAESA